MSEFAKGVVFGNISFFVTMYMLGKICSYITAIKYKSDGKSREELINQWVLAKRKYYERTLPYWEEV